MKPLIIQTFHIFIAACIVAAGVLLGTWGGLDVANNFVYQGF